MPEPKYQRSRRIIEQLCCELGVGAQLPTELQLGERLGVSRITVRRAMGDLERAGIVERVQGRGTWIRHLPYNPAELINPLGFHAQMTPQGYAVTSHVVDYRTVTAGRDTAARLGIDVTTRVFLLQRLRYLDGTLHHLTTAWWPADECLITPDVDFATASLYTVLRESGLDIYEEHISAYLHHPTIREQQLLGLPDASARLATDSTVLSRSGRRLVFAHTVRCREDAVVAFRATVEKATDERLFPQPTTREAPTPCPTNNPAQKVVP